MRNLLAVAAILILSHPGHGTEPLPSGKLQLELEKLGTLASVLYIAAHPDDENTKLLAYLANGAKAKTTYLSLTRGDGGQNLLGADLGEKLGIIRTQELLAARRIDGSEQRFTRANDFGYSKTAEETLEIWGKDEILADMVWVIRSTRPDVIVTRFSLEPGFTHGHHTASAWLAKEAFLAAADPKAFPEQLTEVEPWAAKRLLWNTSSWFYKQRNIEFDPTGLLGIDTGGYDPLLGAGYAEVAANSRSAHRTQGFGATPELGESMEYFVHLEGEPSTDSFLAGIETGWNRVPGSTPVSAAIQQAIEAFTPSDPSQAVPHLLEAHRQLSKLPDSFWRTQKLGDIALVIAGCLALDVESVATTPSAVVGSKAEVIFRAIQRSPHAVEIAFDTPSSIDSQKETHELLPNDLLEIRTTLSLPDDSTISQPYWLEEPHSIGRYTVADFRRIGDPSNPPALPVDVHLTVDGYSLRYTIPTTYNFNDPVRGETKEPFVFTPPATVGLPDPTQIFADSKPRKFTAIVVARSDVQGGQLRFLTQDGWKVEPSSIPFDAKAGEEKTFETMLVPPAEAGISSLRAELVIDGKVHRCSIERIEYDHIPVQTLFPIAEAKIVLLDVKTAGERIGYIPGAGDEVPEALQRMGYAVDILDEAKVSSEDLSQYDAIMLGIRALNTNARIGSVLPALFNYAENGGVVILQYNTNSALKTDSPGPYPFTISRERVTDETAEVQFLAPEHPVMNFPNVINPGDFDHWVQERGLYFASEWDNAFVPILSMNDAGEAPLDGGLLVARHGKGWFVYTGLSWFRQLPAGVPGAYRLFANLVSLGHSQ